MELLAKTNQQVEALAFANTHDLARSLRLSGDLDAAEALLIPVVSEPNIFHGIYQELFLVLRQKNRIDSGNGNWMAVIERVRLMAKLDSEMICAMLGHWSKVQSVDLPPDYFDKDRKLKLADAKTMLKAAESIGDGKAKKDALELLVQFPVPMRSKVVG